MLAITQAVLAPCRPCGAFLENAAASPCGCGTGIVRKVHTRDELKALSQHELDELLRNFETERDELIGAEESNAKKHKKALEELDETAKGLEDKLWGEAGDHSAKYKEKLAEYQKQGEEVAKLEAEVQADAERISTVRHDSIHDDLEMALIYLGDCDCKGSETVLMRRKRLMHKPKLIALRSSVGATEPSGADKLKTVFEIEKLEQEMVGLMEDTQSGQSAYDKKVRQVQTGMEAMERNSTSIHTKQIKSDDLLEERMQAQARGLKPLTAMAESKRRAADAAEAGLAEAKAQLKELDDTLVGCGCK